MDNETKEYLMNRMVELRHKVKVSKKFSKRKNWNNEGHNINRVKHSYNNIFVQTAPHLDYWSKK